MCFLSIYRSFSTYFSGIFFLSWVSPLARCSVKYATLSWCRCRLSGLVRGGNFFPYLPAIWWKDDCVIPGD